MIDLAPFEPADLEAISLQVQQQAEMAALPDWRSLGEQVAVAGPAWTARAGGRVIACGGIGVHWKGRAEAWIFIASDMPRSMWVPLHRLVRRLTEQAIERLSLRRLEASCAYGWPPGRRWLEMLGFQEECVARAYGPDGRDFVRFARVIA